MSTEQQDALDDARRTENAKPGFWLVYYSDWSGIAVFDTEIDALRYAVEKQMQVEFRQWGEIR